MRMVRSFLPVGQGAFYCESFKGFLAKNENINIVYDCGSATNVELVERQIRHTFYEGEDIHAVFISHLHDDHINGLEYLLKYCNVKNIFFPLLTPKEKIYLSLYNIVYGANPEGFTVTFINNPNAVVRATEKETTLYQIAPPKEEDVYYDNSNIQVLESGFNVTEIISESFEIKAPWGDWFYIPFNFRHKDRTNMLQKELTRLFKKECVDLYDLQDIWQNGSDYMRRRIQEAYTRVSGYFNTNSMVLFSGTNEKHAFQHMVFPHILEPRHVITYNRKKSGCLYTGDYDASGEKKFKELYEEYKTYWEYIGCLQIPHHGSRYNYNRNFSTLNAYHIISASKKNRHQHPHSYVIKDLLLNNSYPYIVSEDVGSAVYTVVALR